MVNKLYRRGADKERKLVNKLRAEGFVAARSAGSHSPIDVWAIRPETGEIRLFQLKGSKMPESAKKRLYDSLKYLEGEYMCKVEVF